MRRRILTNMQFRRVLQDMQIQQPEALILPQPEPQPQPIPQPEERKDIEEEKKEAPQL